jgi:AcrR family transcriptional regulator
VCNTLGMAERTAASIRARVRAEMTDEIKAVARRHLAEDGANLSLRAVARELGMVSSAVYRYFPSRDDLLTALIIDAYNSMGEAAEAAEAGVSDRADRLGRWMAVTRALRAWAVARPSEYALLYGSPVPGYAAPEDTVGPATRPVVVMGAILSDAYAAGMLDEPGGAANAPSAASAASSASAAGPVPRKLRAELRRAAELIAAGVSETVAARAMIAWTEVFGAISFDLFGRLNNVIDEREAWFDHQVRAMAAFIGIA